ncbi:MAG: response regulator transcription factor [Candidatus Wildermuthbacteria bacterium]|nr:response regulator transcription factor [Candidatus Wildermuthbacteria bacterium]
MKRQAPVILVVVSLPQDRKLLSQHLAALHYEVLTASDVSEARKVFTELPPNLVIVDVDMPGDEGLLFCSRLRAISNVPLIVLSSRAKESDIVTALKLGADSYLTKPFGVGELLARVHAILRRAEQNQDTGNGTYDFDGLSVDLGAQRVTRHGSEVNLSPIEFSLLSLLVRNAGKVLTHRYILEAIWGSEYTEERDYLRAYVYNLRRKIEPNAKAPTHILNVIGVGYQFALTSASSAN